MKIYKDLISLLTKEVSRRESRRILTPKQLSSSGLAIIDQHHDCEVDVEVYEDGSVVYKQHYHGQCPHTTVFDVRKAAKYKCGSVEYDFSNNDSFMAISIYADQRIIAQNDARWVDNISTVVDENALDVISTNAVDKRKKADAPENIVVRKRNLPATNVATESILDELVRIEEINALHEAIRKITPEQQEFIALYFWEGLTEQKIGALLGISRSSVQSRRNNGMKKLELLLMKYYS